jgi:hypothetical protein
VQIISGQVSSEISTILSTDYAFEGSVHLEFNLDGSRRIVESRLQDLEHVFWVGDLSTWGCKDTSSKRLMIYTTYVSK